LLTLSTTLIAQTQPAEPPPPPLLPPGQTDADVRAYLLERAPRFIPPSDPTAWLEQAEAIRNRVLDEVVYRGVPDPWRTDEPVVVWQDTLEGNGYLIRKLRYEVVPGLWAGALLYEPRDLTGKVPAILCPNGHVGAPGMTVDYKQARCINLAKRGMLTLNLEWIGMGQLARPGLDHGDLSLLDLCGRSGLSVFYLSLKRGLDVLLAHEAADPDRVAVTGLSGGGWQTILISSLDTRVGLTAPNAGYTGIEERIWNDRDVGDREQNATDLVATADYPVLTGLLFPRPALLIYNATDDCCFYAATARASVYRPVEAVYALAGLSDRFALHVNEDPGTHNYLVDNRQAFYRFLNAHFLPAAERRDEEIPVDDEIRPADALTIDYPADNGSFYKLAESAMAELPRSPVPQGNEGERSRWAGQLCSKLRAVAGTVAVQADAAIRRAMIRRDPQAGMPAPAFEPIQQRVEIADGLTCTTGRLRVLGTWTLPLRVCESAAPVGSGSISPPGSGSFSPDAERPVAGESPHPPNAPLPDTASREKEPDPLARSKATTIVLADGGFARARPIAEAEARQGRRVLAADLLFTGECLGGEAAWKKAQMIEAVGRRSLGVQVAQLAELVRYATDSFPQEGGQRARGGVRLVCDGRVAGLAGLVYAALYPGRIEQIELRGMPSSLKSLITDRVSYRDAPSMFCFGLLEAADVPELIALAAPAQVTLSDAAE
jgi:hypothetical protein